MTDVRRYAAFSDDPKGGNPAGVVLDAAGLDDAAMLAIAAEVGYSETAFITGEETAEETGKEAGEEAGEENSRKRVRYFSPLAEVPFCGHATVATAVALGPGEHVFVTNAGEVPVTVRDGQATLTSVATKTDKLPGLEALLEALRWSADDLDPAIEPRVAYAGAYHPVIAARTRQRLADLDYDEPALKALMEARGWTTIQLIFRTGPDSFDVRNPFPVGGVYEDPATGAAAAALGGYLRELGFQGRLRLRQGDDLGRPSRITVEIPADQPGIRVSGQAVPITG